jgi:hypothetical protein
LARALAPLGRQQSLLKTRASCRRLHLTQSLASAISLQVGFFPSGIERLPIGQQQCHGRRGTTYLVTEGAPLSQVTFSQAGGSPFALTSLDYAEWQGGNTAHQITVTGNLVGGGTGSR